MKCPNCKADISEDSHFCSKCGASLKPSKGVSVTKTLQTPTRGFKKDTVIARKYKIIEKLGEGGMGVVYKAKDTRLDRTVALKFLPPELTRDEEARKRFIQEAKAAAALEHPNICIVHEVDESENQIFISMSYIDGDSLKDKLKAGPLGIEEAKDIILQVAEGLKEAHEKGIVHRDIKPANIMLTEKGQAKITDFGLAKLSWGADLTKPATIMGTVAYMSPEQARGEEVDHRTDIWSLGAMLYEMLSGERPFQKAQEQALIYSILNDNPTPLSMLRSDIPTQIEHVIEKALAKKMKERYQHIADLIGELKESPLITFAKAEKSIVVLPFDDLSPDRDQEYFSDGLTEEIISDLSQIRSLRVISRNSAMLFKGTRKATKTIGKELDVQYVLEGSVRKADNNLRITAQLIDASQDTHLWAKKYSGTLDDVFDIQEKVSRSIADALQLHLTPAESDKIAARPIDNIQAYDCYRQSRQDVWVSTEESLDRAVQRIKNGLSIIGNNELLYAALGSANIQYMEMAYRIDEAQFRRVEDCVSKIFELNPDSSFGHILRGRIEFKRGKTQSAVQEIKRGLSLDPNNDEGITLIPFLYAISGKPSAAKAPLQRLKEIDPLSSWNYGMKAWVEILDGQFAPAVQSFKSLHQTDPGNPLFRYLLAVALAANRQIKEACSFIDLVVKDTPVVHFSGIGTFLKHAWLGEKDQALEAVNPKWTEPARFDETFSWHTASGYALIQKNEEALDWLENSVNKGVINYPFFSEYCHWFVSLHKDPGFIKLMKRVKREWENFEV